jgi:hypothetical protein
MIEDIPITVWDVARRLWLKVGVREVHGRAADALLRHGSAGSVAIRDPRRRPLCGRGRGWNGTGHWP